MNILHIFLDEINQEILLKIHNVSMFILKIANFQWVSLRKTFDMFPQSKIPQSKIPQSYFESFVALFYSNIQRNPHTHRLICNLSNSWSCLLAYCAYKVFIQKCWLGFIFEYFWTSWFNTKNRRLKILWVTRR